MRLPFTQRIYASAFLAALAYAGPVYGDPVRVIEQANHNATKNPDYYGYDNAIMRYDYEDGQLYQVYCAPLRITDIQLEPGESLTSEPVGGDAVRWLIARTKSKVNGLDQEHIFIKPTRPGLHTTLAVNTSLRTYHIELTSFETTYMAAVSWNYEQYNMKQIARLDNEAIEPKINAAKINFRYDIDVTKGRHPEWFPTQVYDDGRKTFIHFPEEMQNRECPALFVIGSNGDMQLVNFRVKNDYYIIDRLFEHAELRGGQDGKNIIRIVKRK